MRPFEYVRAQDTQSAIAAVAGDPNARYLAGGTNLVDLMRQGIEAPTRLVDLRDLPYSSIDELPDGTLRIGALMSNSAVARSKVIVERFPALSQAILAGASPQLRNMASVGGNLLQKTRCSYFVDGTFACNKRKPGSGCSALLGYSRSNAILGTSDACIAVNASDMALALLVLEARIRSRGPSGERVIELNDFHRLPGDTPDRETVLEHGELITAVELPPTTFAQNSMYRKVRDRRSYAFALVSVAAAVHTDAGIIRDIRIGLGGVATKPWRAVNVERELVGKPLSGALFHQAAALATVGARTTKYNAFKESLVQRALVRVLQQLTI